MTPAEAARAKREKAAHDKTATGLNKTYADQPEDTYVDPRTATTGLASRIKKKKDLTAGDAAAALAKRKKEAY
jgi:hypothetical protein